MLFNSYQFIFGFLPAVCISYFVVARFWGIRAGVLVLVVGSLFFYGWWNERYLWILLLSIGCNAGFAVALIRGEPKQRLWILLVGLGFNLLLLGYFKYAAFVAQNVSALLGVDWHIAQQPLPLGISFFTFQKIAFLVDAYLGGVVSFDLLHYSLFVTFFPQLIAGPIVRHNEIMPQFETLPRRPRASDFAIGGSIFAIGLFKKVCLADLSAMWVNPVFSAAASGAPIGFVEAWVAALAYSFQLYFDFSGYSDMAIGLARLFGIVLPINFYSPYKSVNIIDFWRRWHITLSRFLRDFLYIPLGGNRHGVARRYLNLAVTMLLGGLWHGAGWTFVLWGAFHGLMLAANHAWHFLRRRLGLPPGHGPRALRLPACILTFVAVTSAWVLVPLILTRRGKYHLVRDVRGGRTERDRSRDGILVVRMAAPRRASVVGIQRIVAPAGGIDCLSPAQYVSAFSGLPAGARRAPIRGGREPSRDCAGSRTGGGRCACRSCCWLPSCAYVSCRRSSIFSSR